MAKHQKRQRSTNPLPPVYLNHASDLDRILDGLPTNDLRKKLEKQERKEKAEAEAKALTTPIQFLHEPVVALVNRIHCKCCRHSHDTVQAFGKWITVEGARQFKVVELAGILPERVEVSFSLIDFCAHCLLSHPSIDVAYNKERTVIA